MTSRSLTILGVVGLLLACSESPSDDQTVADVDDVADVAVDADAAQDLQEDVIESDGSSPDAPESDALGDVGVDSPEEQGEPSFDSVPCDFPAHWPWSVRSQRYPITVHYRDTGDETTAQRAIELLDTSWEIQIEGLGFRPPLPDDGLCGSDDRFDVFLWRDHEESAVDILAENLETEWEDYYTYMILDPWGTYGEAALPATIAHELNHACQAADDWFDAPIIYEMTAVFIEDVVFDDLDWYLDVLVDFQSRPTWSIDRDDGYQTWYMYAAALYLFFLQDRYFQGDPSFVAEMWLLSRNPPGAWEDPALNEPDYQDALDQLLARENGVGFIDSVSEFARWRWYTGDRDDGLHFEEGALFPPEASVRVAATIEVGEPTEVEIDPAPMMLGSAYIDLLDPNGESSRAEVTLDTQNDHVRWVVQAVPGIDQGSDGEVLDHTDGPANVRLSEGKRTLILTALPLDPDYDPDLRDDRRYPVTVRVARQP